MKYTAVAFNWLLCLGFLGFTLSKLANEDWLRAGVVFIVALLLLPPLRQLIDRKEEGLVSRKSRLVAIVGLLMLLYLTGQMNRPESIYDSAGHEARLMEKYDELMTDWPVPYTTQFVETRLGRVHVVICGPEEAPPLLLLHAGGIPSWSWKYNIEGLSRHFRTYAIDAIGEAGKSVLKSIEQPTKDGRDAADLYSEIMDSLGIDKANVVGASYGGFIGANLALYHAQRIEKLVLISPMGMTPASDSTVLRIILLTLFPVEPVQESFIRWMVDDINEGTSEIAEWMRLDLDGVQSREAMPATFSQQQLRDIQIPVLMILGKKDNLVGQPQMVKEYSRGMNDLRTKVLNTSHTVWVEEADRVTELILDFFQSGKIQKLLLKG